MRILLIFIDGLGIGQNNPATNPLSRYQPRFFSIFSDALLPQLPFNGIVIPTCADMGMPGLPQSATGQAALFTGRNAAKELGRHMSGFPTPTLRKIIDESSIFKTVRALDKKGVFANALSQEYFDRRGERISATTRALLAGGFPWLNFEDLRAGRAVSHDLTNEFLRQMGAEVPLRRPEQSARILADIASQADFTLFEFILTDIVGHSQDMRAAQDVVLRLDTLLQEVLSHLNLNETTVILTSDHGNFEDLGTKMHTTNLVPTCVWGAGQKVFDAPKLRIENLADLMKMVLAG
ncbi:MAG: alkaline phosphatase family protein [bacterium]